METNSILKGNILFEKYIRKHVFKYVLILLIYLVGFFIGIIIFNKSIELAENTKVVSQNVSSKIEILGSNTSEVINSYIKQDYIDLFILCMFSFSLIAIPGIAILFFLHAISLGITISALIYTCGTNAGLSFSILIFLVPTIIKSLIVLMIICSSLKFIENILKYKKEIRYEIIRHAVVNIIALIATFFITIYRSISLNMISKILFLIL